MRRQPRAAPGTGSSAAAELIIAARLGQVELVPWARDLAGRLLAEPLPRRWAHTQGVGRKAESIAHIIGNDAETLIAAAWLHDIGYAPKLAATGFHPLDGARYLRDVEHADDTLCRLVAHHSCALIEARHRGVDDDLASDFPEVGGLMSDALLYCDMTTSPDGVPVSVEVRLAEILTRYSPTDVVAMSIREAAPHITSAVRAVSAVLRQSDRPDQPG